MSDDRRSVVLLRQALDLDLLAEPELDFGLDALALGQAEHFDADVMLSVEVAEDLSLMGPAPDIDRLLHDLGPVVQPLVRPGEGGMPAAEVISNLLDEDGPERLASMLAQQEQVASAAASVQLLRQMRDSLKELAGYRTRGHTKQRDLDRGRRLYNAGTSQAVLGNLWDGPPLINRDSGKPFRGVLLTCPRRGQRNPLQLATGCVFDIRVGDAGAGDIDSRTVVGGDGFPIFLEIGKYGSSVVNVTQLGSNDHAPMLSWTDQATIAGDNIPLQAPLAAWIPAGGVAVPETPVPPGSFEVQTEDACQITWRKYNSGAAILFVETLAAGGITRVKGHTVQTDVHTSLQFFVAKL